MATEASGSPAPRSAAGASMLAVALVEEAITLREAGIDAPVLLLTEAPPDGLGELCAIGALADGLQRGGHRPVAAGAATRLGRPVAVHLKVDTGMHRVGADAADVPALAARVAGSAVRSPSAGSGRTSRSPTNRMTPSPRPRSTGSRPRPAPCGRPGRARRCCTPRTPPARSRTRAAATTSSAAASPATVTLPRRRSGGCSPGSLGPGERLRPALALKARVHSVRRLAAGERTSYGRTYELASDALVANVPLGYADGLRRQLGRSGGRGPRQGPAPPDRRHGDDGPAPRRLRERRRGAPRGRGRPHRPAGERGDHRRGVG